MKVKKVILTILSTCLIVSGVFVSPFTAGRIARAETDTVKTAESSKEATKEATKDEKSEEVELTEEQKAAKEREEAMLALRKDPNHIHKYKWIAKMNESESAEGTLNYMCPECGKTWYYRTIPAYTAFSGDVAHRIETAPEGENVKVRVVKL